MLLAPLVLISVPAAISRLDTMAKARDVDGLTKELAAVPAHSPFAVLRTGGAYGTGKFGWHALSLKDPDGTEYAVVTTPVTVEDIGALLFRLTAQGLVYLPEGRPQRLHVQDHDVDVRFDTSHKSVAISDRMSVHVTSAGIVDVRLSASLKVASIQDDKGLHVPFHQAGGITLVKPSIGTHSLTLQYGGVLDWPRFAGSVSPGEASLANDYWIPMVSRQPAPCTVTAHAPAGWTIVGQGKRLLNEQRGNEHISRFRMPIPIVYYSLSAAKYKSATVKSGALSVTAWGLRETLDTLHAQAETYQPVIDFYSTHFGSYPFTSYGALSSPGYGGGALEAYSYATYGGGFPVEDPHEPSHTWWGGILDNTYLKSFWNESFADFCEGLYRREAPIGNVDERRMAFMEDGNASAAYDVASCAEASAEYGPAASSIGYGKGSQVLQMLEQVVGTGVLVDAMRNWVARDHGKAVSWEDFESVIRPVGAEGMLPPGYLDRFLKQWLHQPGYAKFTVGQPHWDGKAVIVPLSFDKDSPRTFPVDVLTRRIDGKQLIARVLLDGEPVLKVPCDVAPTLVSVDPCRRLVRRITQDEEPVSVSRLLRQGGIYADPQHGAWPSTFGLQAMPGLPEDPAGKTLIGSPDSSPLMKKLWGKAGFMSVNGEVMYLGRNKVDLEHGGGAAVVDLDGGKQCLLLMGTSRIRPELGRARTAVFDQLGRFLNGRTDLKTTGPLTFTMPGK